MRFEHGETGGRGTSRIRIIGTFLDANGTECETHLGYIESEIAKDLVDHDVSHLWGRIRCIRPPGAGRRPTFCMRFDLLVELDEISALLELGASATKMRLKRARDRFQELYEEM